MVKPNFTQHLPPAASPELANQYPQGWDQSGSLEKARKTHKVVSPWCKFESTITVPVRRLDSWAHAHDIDRVDFIWADIQGAEGDLVAGAHSTLARTRYLYTEYSNDEWYEGQPTLQPSSWICCPTSSFSIASRWTCCSRTPRGWIGGLPLLRGVCSPLEQFPDVAWT